MLYSDAPRCCWVMGSNLGRRRAVLGGCQGTERASAPKETQTSQQGEPGNGKAALGALQSSGQRLCASWIVTRS